MISIINGRDTGKTKQLLELARRKHATVLTTNKRGLIVKANSLGFKDVKIIDYNDLNNDCFDITAPIVIHQVDKALEYLFDYWYNVDILGYTAHISLAGYDKQLQKEAK